ncbi:glycoside hydrolase family 2 protein [Reichenbachiella versicolor]|uniref:glycoside hydrolase family 2 protein n=1 Tax=Reichenbachiella versicolor TaxID=1821036 RepID=UPI000D6E9F65|nr:glycoside hydrolase family 2 TIM barrel-domain containing protein [Reichenbachiella versicolor]
MKKLVTTLLLMLFTSIAIIAQPKGYENLPRTRENINLNWKWMKDKAETPSNLDINSSAWEQVSIPHNPDPVTLNMDEVRDTWPQKESMRDINWYRKEMKINRTNDQLVFLEFEGVHSVTEVWINGQYAGKNDLGGYTPFHIDITNLVKSGELNDIMVKADNRFDKLVPPDPHKTDYIKWGGIYRDVYLVTTNKLRVNFNWEDNEAGVRITTPTVKRRYGIVAITTTVANSHDSNQNTEVVTKIVNAAGLVLKTVRNSKTVLAGASYSFKQSAVLEDNDFFTWSPDKPYLYRAVSYIYSQGKLVDFVENKFGFRKLELVDGQGLLLNGEPFFMIGANRHQSFAHIGDAVPNSMHYEEALRFKEAGFNTIRLSHYPQDDAFIEACDELGILLYEEPATWILWEQGEWMDKLEESARVMVRNHRNHPSIAIWGAGINHRGNVPRLAKAAKEEDPTRLTASASSPWNGMRHAGPTDIYATMDYRRSDWAEEGFTLVMEHGCNPSGAANQFHISRYKKRKNNIGTLTWVAADYYQFRKDTTAEKHTNYAVLDMYRNKRPVYHWYRSEMNEKEMVHIGDERVSSNGIVHVYSNADRVELYANNKLIGSQLPDNVHEKSNNDHPSFSFYFDWKDEDLKAIAYINGNQVAMHERKMPATPYALKLKVDYPELKLLAGGSDVKMVRAYVVDRNNEIVTNANKSVHFEVTGQGELVDEEKDYMNQMKTYDGIATVFIRGTEVAGQVKIKATSSRLKSSSLVLNTVEEKSNDILANAQDIYDFPIWQVDIGHKEQLPQFDWTAWNVSDTSDLKFTDRSGVLFSVSSAGEIQWTKGQPTMLGDLPFVGADGVFVKGSSISLSIKGLKAGKYKIITYHNAISHKGQFPYNINNDIQHAERWKTPDQHMVGYFKHNDSGERAPIHYTQFFDVIDREEVNLDFLVDIKDSFTWLNGFELRKVK